MGLPVRFEGDGTAVGTVAVGTTDRVDGGATGVVERRAVGDDVVLPEVAVVPVGPVGTADEVVDGGSEDVLVPLGTAGTDEGAGPGRPNGPTRSTRAATASATSSTSPRTGVRSRRRACRPATGPPRRS